MAAAVTAAAVALFFLLPYFRQDYRYPLGWDSPFYVWRANLVPLEGLDRNGLVRSASPVLLAVLSRLTGQNTWTLVALVPALLAGIASLGGAGMARAGLGLPVRWVAVVGLLLWLGFGYAGMVWEQFDNVLNSALVLGGFAAALAVVAWGRGAVAAGLLFVAAGFAHWQFYLFAMAIFVLAVLAFGRDRLGAAFGGDRGSLNQVGPLLASAGVSGAAVGLGFLVAPFSPSVGPRFVGLGDLLRDRFLRRAAEPDRYAALPLAVAGGLLAYRSSSSVPSRPARDLFLWLIGVWTGLTLLGAAAQALGAPTAGLRLLHFLFPMTILAGVFVWKAGEELARRLPRGPATAATAVVVIGVLGAFGAFALSRQSRARVWVEPNAVYQAAAAGAYTYSEVPPQRRVLYVVESDPEDSLTFARWRNTILSSIPPSEISRSEVAKVNVKDSPLGMRAGAVIAIGAYAPTVVRDAAAQQTGMFVGDGVVVLRGPSFPSGIKATPSTANLAARAAIPVAGLIAVLLFVAGAGWAFALLPADAATRILLSPALGIAVIVTATLIWERLGLSLGGWLIAVPGALSAAAGWVLSVVRR